MRISQQSKYKSKNSSNEKQNHRIYSVIIANNLLKMQKKMKHQPCSNILSEKNGGYFMSHLEASYEKTLAAGDLSGKMVFKSERVWDKHRM